MASRAQRQQPKPALNCLCPLASQQTTPGAGNNSRLEAPPVACLFNSLLREDEVQWSEQPDGRAHQMSLRGCALRRFSHAEARQCLSGKRLVFLGDSVTRWVGLSGGCCLLPRTMWLARCPSVPCLDASLQPDGC